MKVKPFGFFLCLASEEGGRAHTSGVQLTAKLAQRNHNTSSRVQHNPLPRNHASSMGLRRPNQPRTHKLSLPGENRISKFETWTWVSDLAG